MPVGFCFAAGEDEAGAEEAELPSWQKARPLSLPELGVQQLHPGQRGQQPGGGKVEPRPGLLSSGSRDP